MDQQSKLHAVSHLDLFFILCLGDPVPLDSREALLDFGPI